MLIKTLAQQGFSFQTFSEYILNGDDKTIILRHDVDKCPGKSLYFATIQAEAGIKGTYYFRVVPCSWNEDIIRQIACLGHEIGYHYEDVNLVAQEAGYRKQNGTIEKEVAASAIKSFKQNLEKLRKIVPVKSACMHGSPLSRWDNRLLWEYYNYHDFGILGEPYFDINFNKVLYITDTGRRWDGDLFSIRDKTTNNIFPRFHSTSDIIRAAQEGKLPDKIMMTFHPQRWTGKPLPWAKELVWQNMKNVGKYFLVKIR